jgi:preprotein translocase subunit SecD
VLRGGGDSRTKYVLGPVVVDGSDVANARAAFTTLGNETGWVVKIRLDPVATKTFQRATMRAVVASPPQNEIAIVVHGRVAASPTVQGVISNGAIRIPGLSESSAKALARALGGSS